MEERRKFFMSVRHDVNMLLKYFEKTNSVRLAQFCQVWKQMHFSQVFCNRNTAAELLEFTEEILHLTKNYLLPVHDFQKKIGALYALYGLYFKQPLIGAAKIRFTESEWENTVQLVGKCIEEDHYDAAFVHYQLYIKGAYDFICTPRTVGLEKGFRKYDSKQGSRVGKAELEVLKNVLVDSDALSSLLTLENLYFTKKKKLLGDKDFLFVDVKFGEKLKRKYEHPNGKTSESFLHQNNAHGLECDGGDKELADNKTSTIGDSRVRLKKKSFATTTTSQLVNMDESKDHWSHETRRAFGSQTVQNKAKAVLGFIERNSALSSIGDESSP